MRRRFTCKNAHDRPMSNTAAFISRRARPVVVFARLNKATCPNSIARYLFAALFYGDTAMYAGHYLSRMGNMLICGLCNTGWHDDFVRSFFNNQSNFSANLMPIIEMHHAIADGIRCRRQVIENGEDAPQRSNSRRMMLTRSSRLNIGHHGIIITSGRMPPREARYARKGVWR